MIKLILSAPVPAMAQAFDSAFSAIPDVTVHRGPFETLEAFDCMVSAANSFGLMDGGVDAAITAFFGTQLQTRVQNRIIREYLGEQPVGTAFVIESGNSNHPWLVHAPTMRVPQAVDGTDAVYNATRAALLAIHQHNLNATDDKKIRTVVFPAMGAGCGRVPPESVARQMLLAWQSVILPTRNISWQYATERQRAVFNTTAYCPSATCCPNAGTGYIGLGDYRTTCSRTGQPCISLKHQADDVLSGAYQQSTHVTPGSHSHGVPSSTWGRHDHNPSISIGAHSHGVKK
ncbi:phage tail protein [Erwinia sp. OLTSP20]|uniref:macro domain-containing protein n=1 Tax=unclassified Erwinia TaxID=2622719 RepID=UPI000C181883|nr:MULTISPECIES: macro domain-containing protein [unclassified Erwinia]PIJ48973.1 phage tail protein [Erwinia sp. OAMSP11]PIJ74626.1 phage tail protein [Erwinia sp. OLSSP12]PIJ79657.1 phage tail protein [Erwinia sp. OLCASP19]PIJ80442.1 phage tail protein [Erwinia sp. OLMTSP26]PIJ82557.1 phage tail protein [Erwinia sp. OLMDSP33]